MAINLQQFLAKQLSDGAIDQQLCDLLNAVADLSKEINDKVTHGAIAGVLGFAGTDNVQGEHQKKLDVITNEIFVEGVEWTGALAGMASEEMDHCLPTPSAFKRGEYLIMFDPLDGSSNIDINAPIGTIFSITNNPDINRRHRRFHVHAEPWYRRVHPYEGKRPYSCPDPGICDQHVQHETLGSSGSEVCSRTFGR